MEDRYTYKGDVVKALTGRLYRAVDKKVKKCYKFQGFLKTTPQEYKYVWEKHMNALNSKVEGRYEIDSSSLRNAWKRARREMEQLNKDTIKKGLIPVGNIFRAAN